MSGNKNLKRYHGSYATTFYNFETFLRARNQGRFGPDHQFDSINDSIRWSGVYHRAAQDFPNILYGGARQATSFPDLRARVHHDAALNFRQLPENVQQRAVDNFAQHPPYHTDLFVYPPPPHLLTLAQPEQRQLGLLVQQPLPQSLLYPNESFVLQQQNPPEPLPYSVGPATYGPPLNLEPFVPHPEIFLRPEQQNLAQQQYLPPVLTQYHAQPPPQQYYAQTSQQAEAGQFQLPLRLETQTHPQQQLPHQQWNPEEFHHRQPEVLGPYLHPFPAQFPLRQEPDPQVQTEVQTQTEVSSKSESRSQLEVQSRPQYRSQSYEPYRAQLLPPAQTEGIVVPLPQQNQEQEQVPQPQSERTKRTVVNPQNPRVDSAEDTPHRVTVVYTPLLEIEPTPDINMGVPLFNQWATESGLMHELQLSDLHPEGSKGEPIIGIEAGHFLEQFRRPSKEPLVPALGGYPLALENYVVRNIKNLEKVGVKVWVYFDGLEASFDDTPLELSITAAQTVSEGFDIYESGQPGKAIDKFRQTEYPDTYTYYRYLKSILHKNGINFCTAPYRALAQIKHHLDQDLLHAVYASTDAFLYGISRVITKMNMVFEPHEYVDNNGETKREIQFQLDKSTYFWVDFLAAIRVLHVSQEVFHDSMLLAGSSYLEAFPPLLNPAQFPPPVTFRTITDVLANGYYGDVNGILDFYSRDEKVQDSKYVDRFKKIFVAINNMPILVNAYTVKPRSMLDSRRYGNVPRDLHDIVGLCLPEELYYYLYMGLIGPKIMNHLVKGEIKLQAPVAGEKTPQYRKLVKTQLKGVREQALAVIAYSINRWFLTQGVTTTSWYDDSKDRIVCKDLRMEKETLSTWRMKGDPLSKRAEQLKSEPAPHGPGSLFFAFKSLTDKDFAASSIASKSSSTLKTVKEIAANAIWRFMYLRSYIDNKHQLTEWGRLMVTVLDKFGTQGTNDLAEAAFIAVEMLRFGLLNVDELVPGGGPSHGNDTDKLNCVLVSRVACMGKMRHPCKGYSGPLSRSLLAYHSLVSQVRCTLRDLMEVVTACMFLDGQVDRLREDYQVIAEWLPFQQDWSDGLGVLTMTYLDEIATNRRPDDTDEQAKCMDQCEMYLVHTEVKESLEDMLKLWASVAEGVRSSGKLVDNKYKELFAHVNNWLVPRTKAFI